MSQEPPQYVEYPRDLPTIAPATGQNDLFASWLFVIMGIFACPLLGLGTILTVNRAVSLGYPGARKWRTIQFVVQGLNVIGWIVRAAISFAATHQTIRK